MKARSGARRYEVDASSTLTFSATSSMNPVHGKAADVSGYVELALNSDGTIALEAPATMHVGFMVDSLRTGSEMQDREMARLIDSRRFPKIAADLRELRSGSVRGRFVAIGDITMAGLARRYEGDLSIQGNDEHLAISGEISVDVRDFGLKPMNLLVLSVAPIVKVRLRLSASRSS